jgi:hypothetical protein
MNEAQVSEFELLQGKLQGLYDEVLTLSKKSPTDPFNKFKLKLTNSVLGSANRFLREQDMAPPVDGFEQFDDIELPFNSDVVVVLSQYLQCLEKLRADNIAIDGGHWYWVFGRKCSDRQTAPPQKIK